LELPLFLPVVVPEDIGIVIAIVGVNLGLDIAQTLAAWGALYGCSCLNLGFIAQFIY